MVRLIQLPLANPLDLNPEPLFGLLTPGFRIDLVYYLVANSRTPSYLHLCIAAPDSVAFFLSHTLAHLRAYFGADFLHH